VSVLDRLRHPGWTRRGLFGLGLLLALTIIIRLALDPVAAHFTHKQLNASEAVSGDFESVHVTLLPPGYGIRRLKIIHSLMASATLAPFRPFGSGPYVSKRGGSSWHQRPSEK
jgi:hypothetical protein